MRTPLVSAAILVLASPVMAQTASRDSASVAATIAEFHTALAGGDSSRALRLLAADVTVLEAGGIETLADYRSRHLAADIRFAQAVPSSRAAPRIVVQGDVAWAVSTSETVGSMDGRAINSVGAELMILSREGTGWRIRAIHWSSRRRAAP
jgi:ketosteroid isomerase-like protein